MCLPSAFDGGSLLVQHCDGNVVKFDWGHHSASKIQWAAFYSDCDHQFQPIKSGYQVILVYRMYVTEPIGSSIVHHDPIIDPQSLPMYNYIKELVEQPAFFRERS